MDMMKLMGNLKDIQAKMKAAQDSLEYVTSEAESGAGMVKVKVNGLKQLLSLDIDPALVKPEDREVMQDLVIAAVDKALQDVEVLSRETLKKSTDGLLPNIPGFDLGI